MNRLDYLKDTRGIGVFTAGPGMGKSFGLRYFTKALNPNLYHMEYICLSTVSVMEFYRQLCAVLGLEVKGGKPGMFDAIQAQIFHLYKDKRQPLLLAVDEAQYLSTAILNDIKMLMNFSCDSMNCFTLILCGDPISTIPSESPFTKPSASGSPSITILPAFPIPRLPAMSATRSPAREARNPSSTPPLSPPFTATPKGIPG